SQIDDFHVGLKVSYIYKLIRAEAVGQRSMSKDEYSEKTTLPLPRMLNHMRQAASNIFDTTDT
ncbi:UNVERIFIED_CONTAM: hypothetical protein HDU68_005048, partial [Siphonaria sp. JEL0065]